MKIRQILCLLMCLLLLTSCTSQPDAAPVPTLPPHTAEYTAPIGDAGLNHETIAVLYLPSLDGQRLLSFYETLTLSRSQHPAETIVRALLNHEGNSRVRALGGGVSISLAGSNPVEVTGGVCTVNLTPSALQLPQEDFYTVCQSLAATLCALSDVHHVNVMVAGQAVAMDGTGSLPLGSLDARPGQELPVLWEQMAARRSPVGVDPALTAMTATATLYFPLADGSGIAPEVRQCAFPGQHPGQLAQVLLDELSTGALDMNGAADMPDLTSLMTKAPDVTTLASGGKRITLHFSGDVRARMTEAGADPACCFAAIVMTLTTFIPSAEQVCILTGDTALTSLLNPTQGSLLFPGGLHRRQDYAAYLMAQPRLWAAQSDALAVQSASVPYRSARSPRQLLLTLAALPAESAVMPADLTDADILGLSVQGDTLLINLSTRYAQSIRRSGLDQRLMAYSIVSTMCSAQPVKRVRFFFGSEPVDDLGGTVVWSGEFLHNPGLDGGSL